MIPKAFCVARRRVVLTRMTQRFRVHEASILSFEIAHEARLLNAQ